MQYSEKWTDYATEMCLYLGSTFFWDDPEKGSCIVTSGEYSLFFRAKIAFYKMKTCLPCFLVSKSIYSLSYSGIYEGINLKMQ